MNIKSPKVCILMAVYNGEKYVEKSIQGVKKQNYHNWKLIIVNDNSKDLTK